jgi:ankyrin repeat protein
MNRSDDLFAAVRHRRVDDVRRILERSPEAVRAQDDEGATALHYATEIGARDIVELLLQAGADINARDAQFHATPSGWAIEYLRQRGGLLGVEIEDAGYAIARRDRDLVRRYVTRLPALREAATGDGRPLRQLAAESGDPEIARLFEA